MTFFTTIKNVKKSQNLPGVFCQGEDLVSQPPLYLLDTVLGEKVSQGWVCNKVDMACLPVPQSRFTHKLKYFECSVIAWRGQRVNNEQNKTINLS